MLVRCLCAERIHRRSLEYCSRTCITARVSRSVSIAGLLVRLVFWVPHRSWTPSLRWSGGARRRSHLGINHLVLRELAPGVTVDDLRAKTAAPVLLNA